MFKIKLMNNQSYILERTNAKTVVLMIHGILGTPRHFDFLMPYINEDCAIYNILLKGHGSDALNFAHSSMDAWKCQVEECFLDLAIKYQEIIIVAHSMGGLFAIELALKYPTKIKTLYLLQPALKIGPKTRLFSDCLKIYFNLVKEDDYKANALIKASSIKLDPKFYHYLLWLPRYLELFKEASLVSKKVNKLKTKTYVYISDDDEMVSRRVDTCFVGLSNVTIRHLKTSTHDYYAEADQRIIIEDFKIVNKV